MKFYTHIQRWGKTLLLRGYNSDGSRAVERVKYIPTLYALNSENEDPDPLETLYGEPVVPLRDFEDMKDAKEQLNQYKNVDNFDVYGFDRFEYAFLNERFPGKVDYDLNMITVTNLDIETTSNDGFPEPEDANDEITAITVQTGGKYYSFGCGDFKPKDENVLYVKCKDEYALITKFLKFWKHLDPDVVTGWYIEGFDIPYLVRRITKLFNYDKAKELSPWGILFENKNNAFGKEKFEYNLVGIATLDYVKQYQYFVAPYLEVKPEDYKLNTVAYADLGEKKLDFSEYGSLQNLYKHDFQKFMEYNIRDTNLVNRLDDMHGILGQTMATAYDAKVNFEDVYMQVRMWDVIVHNELLARGIVTPPKKYQRKDDQYAGAAVKEPIVGMHDWVVSYDLNSLYPHLIMQWNISPETLDPRSPALFDIDQFIKTPYDRAVFEPVPQAFCCAGNGYYFDTTIQGFLPEIMQEKYNTRKAAKAEQKKNEELYEKAKDKKYKVLAAKHKNIQSAMKVQLNSAYGALGSEYFRLYDIRLAEAITLSGQLAIKWIIDRVNRFMNKTLGTTAVDYIIASDTDSIYVNFKPLVDIVNDGQDLCPEAIVEAINQFSKAKVEPFIAKRYKELAQITNCVENKMDMGREKISEKGIWTAKKRYILNVWDNEGVRYTEPKLAMTGIETVRSSTPEKCRDALKECLKLIMNSDESTVQKYISEFKEKFRGFEFGDISSPTGVNGLAQYRSRTSVYKKGSPFHVKGALMYNHLLQENKLTKKYPLILEGEKIRYAYLKEPNPTISNCIAVAQFLPEEFDLKPFIDYDRQFEKNFLSPLTAILDVIGWEAEKVSNLEAFFG
tara:strand:+ start:666 stop:3191 length:2526 start_codon:yes stop_codon:yes gene_type:complete